MALGLLWWQVGMRHLDHGFTLIEVLVALSIVAIALAAGVQATGALTRLAERQTQQWLAQWCADNALVALRLAEQMPVLGRAEQPCEQAGRAFQVVLDTSATPNPSFRRVQASVQLAPDSEARSGPILLQMATVIGRF
jgi:general secretion pathway protein I